MSTQSGTINLGNMVEVGDLGSKLQQASNSIDKLISEMEKLGNTSISPKIDLQINTKEINAVEKTAKNLRTKIERVFDKPYNTKSLLPTDKLTGNDKRQLNKLVDHASKQNVSSEELENAKQTYTEIMQLMVSIRKTENDIKDQKGVFSSTDKFDAEKMVQQAKVLQELQNSRSKMVELNKSLPENLRITDDIYKKFGQVADIEKGQKALEKFKQTLLGTAMDNLGLSDVFKAVDEAKRTVSSGNSNSSSSTATATKQQEDLAKATKEANDELQKQKDINSGGDKKANTENIDKMKEAYRSLYEEEEKLFNLSNNEVIDTNAIEASRAKIEGLKKTCSDLATEVKNEFGKETQKSSILDVNKDFKNNYRQLIKDQSSGYLQELNALQKQIPKGKVFDSYRDQIKSLKTDLSDISKEFTSAAQSAQKSGSTIDTSVLQKLTDFKTKFANQTGSIKQSLTQDSSIISSFNEADKMVSKLEKLSTTVDKIPAFSTKVGDLKNELEQLFSGFSDKSITSKDAETRLKSLMKQLAELDKIKGQYKSETKDGILDESTFGNVKNVDDATAALKNYAEALGLVKQKGLEVSNDNKKITASYVDSNNKIVKLIGTLNKDTSSIRFKQEFAGSNSFLSSFGNELASIGGHLATYFSGYRMITRLTTEFKNGLNVLKEYDAALTTISYTMDLNQQGLDNLGKSAVNMAKDLSMSISDAESIYQIYANMNTSAQEIAETAKPTAILSNLSGVDASTASDQVQGILQQFDMLKDGTEDVAATSMHVVDVLDKISANVSIDYAKGIGVITDAVTAAGAVANDAGLSFEELAAISAKVAERTREDGGSIGNAIKTIATRISKVGEMPAYADEVSNEELSKASESLHQVGIEVYNADGSYRELGTILSELQGKWDSLTDAQQANISFNVAA